MQRLENWTGQMPCQINHVFTDLKNAILYVA